MINDANIFFCLFKGFFCPFSFVVERIDWCVDIFEMRNQIAIF